MRVWLALAIIALSFHSAASSAQTDAPQGPGSGAYFPDGASGPNSNAIEVQTDSAASTPPQTPDAPAKASYQDVSAGGWSSLRQIEGTTTTCGVHGLSTAGDPVFLFAASNAPGFVTLQMSKPVWSIPPKTPIHLHVAFDNNVQLDLTGEGEGTTVKAAIDASTLKSWTHGFTAASNMQISFVGATALAWSFSLTGTTPTISAMAECAKEANIYIPDPYNTGFAPGAPNNPDGQPFAMPTGSQAPDTPVTTQSAQPNSTEGGAETNSGSATTAPTPDANQSGCKGDWHQCKDNADLVNNFTDWYIVQSDCKTEANREVKYGSPIWPGFFAGGAFASFRDGTDYVTSGMAIAIEPDVQIQNQFGAMVHSTAYCTYDLNKKAVTDITFIPN